MIHTFFHPTELSSILNFNLKIIIDTLPHVGFIKGKPVGGFQKLMNRNGDFMIASVPLTVENMMKMETTRVYHMYSVIYSIPPGKPFTFFEKLCRPFSVELWISLMSILGVATFTIFIINYFGSPKFKKFLFGSIETSPFMNLVSYSLTGSIANVNILNGNISRFIFSLLLISYIILSSAYSGKLFDILQTDLRHPTFENVREVWQSDYKFLFYKVEYNFLLPNNPDLKNRTTFIKNNHHYDELLKRISIDPYFKAVRAMNFDNFRYRNNLALKEGRKTMNFCPEMIKMFLTPIFSRKNSHIPQDFSRELLNLESNGIMEKIRKEYIYSDDVKVPESPPQALELRNLFKMGYILLGGHCLAFLSFIMEVVVKKLQTF